MSTFSPRRPARPLDADEQRRLTPVRERLLAWFSTQPGQTVRREAFFALVASAGEAERLLQAEGGFVEFAVSAEGVTGARWVRPAAAPAGAAEAVARAVVAGEANRLWEALRPLCGDVLRHGAQDGPTARQYVMARSYLTTAAAVRLGLPARTLEAAVEANALPGFTDPRGRVRLAAAGVEAAAESEAQWESLAAWAILAVRDIALVSGLADDVVRGRLAKAGFSRTAPRWGQVRGQWGLPVSLRAFRELAAQRRGEWRAAVETETRRSLEAALAAEKAARAASAEERHLLRQRLLQVFPAWQAGRRPGQQVTLHLGPTNSGKTHDALNILVQAGSGWYLAPLRLLAHEVFDTLNRRGVPCNLVTGEIAVAVPGAQITASTIEMFNPQASGACTVIDEAHMLADESRGWAWTQALMESQAPDIRVIGAPSVAGLARRLAAAAGLPVETQLHERLAPLSVAAQPWSLAALPRHTILVAFSRERVLGLKTELERTHNRAVSVIYGALPPEVRSKQAARFADGETDLCVATDAVGMGLNLPANQVCFFEVTKFDGQQRRPLSAHEVRQIAGRAGRFGLADAGRVGALNREDLEFVRSSLAEPEAPLQHARVAPTAEALAVLPGTLEAKLRQWTEMNSIPDLWRGLLRATDLTDSIAMAHLLRPADVAAIGEAAALSLIRAPATDGNLEYWQRCAAAIVRRQPMPRPFPAPDEIRDAAALSAAEDHIRCADVYLWLSRRPEFSRAAPAAAAVRERRAEVADALDGALRRRVQVARRCRVCGRHLPVTHRFNLCDRCFRGRRNSLDFG